MGGRALSFIRLTGCILMICVARPPQLLGFFTSSDSKDLTHRHPLFLSPSTSTSLQEPAPAPASIKPRKKTSDLRHISKRRSGRENLKSARRVGYFFGGIAILLQVALVVFLVIKRKQMIGLVNKFDEALTTGSQSRCNGVDGPAS